MTNSTYKNDMLFARKLINAVLEFFESDDYMNNQEMYSGGQIEYKEDGILCFNKNIELISFYSTNYDSDDYIGESYDYDFPFVDVTDEDGHFQMSLTMQPIYLRIAVLFTLMRKENIPDFAIPMDELRSYGIDAL